MTFARPLMLSISLAAAALLPGAALAQAVPAPAKVDWSKSYAATPDGGFAIGNPKAPMTLTEFGSYTCSHCRDFHLNDKPKLMPYIASGKVRYEFRSFLRNSVDMVISMVTYCQTPDRFWGVTDLMFRDQEGWIKGFTGMNKADMEALKGKPLAQVLPEFATKSGFSDYLRKKGLPAASVSKCLSAAPTLTKLQGVQKVAYERYAVQGTPTFLINGEVVEGANTFELLEPRLKAGK